MITHSFASATVTAKKFGTKNFVLLRGEKEHYQDDKNHPQENRSAQKPIRNQQRACYAHVISQPILLPTIQTIYILLLILNSRPASPIITASLYSIFYYSIFIRVEQIRCDQRHHGCNIMLMLVNKFQCLCDIMIYRMCGDL